MKSIRVYLILALLATIALGNFIAAVYGYKSSMQAAQDLLDIQIADTAALLRDHPRSASSVVPAPSDRIAYQIWGEDGTLIQSTDNSGTGPVAEFAEGFSDRNFAGRRWRVLTLKASTGGGWVMVAERIDIRTGLADSIIRRAVLPIVAAMPVVAAIVWIVVGNGLSLIQRLARELREKRADDLSPLATAEPPVELAPVVDAINDLLRRLDESVLRERRFSADAAHELRSPISALKVHVHNLHAELPESGPTLQMLERDLGRLSHLVEQILLLYRLTPEHYQARMEQVDLLTLAQSVISDCYVHVEQKKQTIALDGGRQFVTGDEQSLTILLRNLILNASKYSPEGASISIALRQVEAGMEIAVEDSGPGIPPDKIERVFDRFYRVGGDRHASSEEGCGLGLAIVRHIADLHHARVSIRNKDRSGGLVVRTVFPREFDPLLVRKERKT